ncbi:hypothetical protein B0H66DRAFT_178865 [Apodospora peruviana]|uniref:F-box domain-containing protein n=1 Tax=Apodospora peruviana TaxID=516989 RepID=A0AAE0IB49_9PEZI|nr:hypothetical protein B0H66DRAFT_178865 [Apodospora peruviana]
MTRMIGTTDDKAMSLSADVWYLILRNVADRADLARLCRVCKALYPLANRILYRKITVGPPVVDRLTHLAYLMGMSQGQHRRSKSTGWAESLALVRRLAADHNSAQTTAVCEIDIVSRFEHDFEHTKLHDMRPEFEEALPSFVSVLPNLRQVRIFSPSPAFDTLFRVLHEHPNKPEIHLLREDGSRPVSGPMPGVVTVKVSASPWSDTPEKPNTVIPGTEKLFFACPDLKSFSLSVHNNYGGCMRPPIYHPIIKTFQFASSSGDEQVVVFPPLESLSLSGYDMDVDKEWPRWRDGLDWSRLKSLSLGLNPRYAGGPTMADLLEQFQGHATALRSLTIQTWAAEGHETCPPLESFLASFDALEELTVKRHFVPIETLAGHSRLKRLCLHCIETKRPEGAFRPTLGVADLARLDASCPDLESLEIDISRDDAASGEWPNKILVEALAGSFSNLRRLTLHCEVGLVFDWSRPQDKPSLPLLDEALIRAFAEPFFASRGASKMERLTIKTGETLRRFPQWNPGYRLLEEASTRQFNAWLQITDGEVRVQEHFPA